MMKRYLLLVGAVGVCVCAAQEFELGGAGGYGIYRNRTFTSGTRTAEAGFRRGISFSAVAGNDMHRLLGGEVRYTYRQNDLSLKSGASDSSFSGEAHMVHYDALLHATSNRAKLRPFIAFGGGLKYFRGTGTESESQPLQTFAVMTRTSELLPMVSLGGGVKFTIGSHALLRFEFRDYLTPFPAKVLLPAPGVQGTGWLHDLTSMIGISARF